MKKQLFTLYFVIVISLLAGCGRKGEIQEQTLPQDPVTGSWHTVGLYYEGDIFTVGQLDAMDLLTDITMELTSNHHFSGTFTAGEQEDVEGLWAEESLRGYDHVYSMSLGCVMILNNENSDVMYFGFDDNNGDLMLILNRDGTNNHQTSKVADEDKYAVALSLLASMD